MPISMRGFSCGLYGDSHTEIKQSISMIADFCQVKAYLSPAAKSLL